jgi:hypothetical protein
VNYCKDDYDRFKLALSEKIIDELDKIDEISSIINGLENADLKNKIFDEQSIEKDIIHVDSFRTVFKSMQSIRRDLMNLENTENSWRVLE